MGIYPYGKCEKCGNSLSFFSGNMSVWGHKENCPTKEKKK